MLSLLHFLGYFALLVVIYNVPVHASLLVYEYKYYQLFIFKLHYICFGSVKRIRTYSTLYHSNKYTSVLPWIFVTSRTGFYWSSTCDSYFTSVETDFCSSSTCDSYSTSVQLTNQQISTYLGSHIADAKFQIWLVLPYNWFLHDT